MSVFGILYGSPLLYFHSYYWVVHILNPNRAHRSGACSLSLTTVSEYFQGDTAWSEGVLWQMCEPYSYPPRGWGAPGWEKKEYPQKTGKSKNENNRFWWKAGSWLHIRDRRDDNGYGGACVRSRAELPLVPCYV